MRNAFLYLKSTKNQYQINVGQQFRKTKRISRSKCWGYLNGSRSNFGLSTLMYQSPFSINGHFLRTFDFDFDQTSHLYINYNDFCLGVTSLFDFKLLNKKPFNSFELECAVKVKHCIWKKMGFLKKRTLVVILLKQDYRANILMFHVFLVIAERINQFY